MVASPLWQITVRGVAAAGAVRPAIAWRSAALHLSCLLGVWMLFELPSVVRPDRLDLGALHPAGEIPALLTLAGLSYRWRWGGAVRRLLAGAAVVLCLVRIDEVIFFYLMRSEPLLYDQLFMARHLFVLVGDLWNARVAAIAGGAVLAVALLVYVLRALLRTLREGLAPSHRPVTLRILAVLWALLLADVVRADPWTRWLTPKLVDNVQRSLATYRHVHEAVEESPYRGYDALRLTRKPDVRLFLVESYGRVLYTDVPMKKRYFKLLKGFERELSEQGYHVASAWTKAPVSGGRSWLAEATLLTGMRVRYEAVFHQLAQRMQHTPNLVRLLAGQGYETILLAPADRERPGIKNVNRYGWDRIVRYNDLNWRGPRIGWGLVPDQYSLEHTREHVLSKIERPLFFDYHMVSSHAPWLELPRLQPDWRQLGRQPELVQDASELEASEEVLKGMRRYKRRLSTRYMGEMDGAKRERYQRAVHYSLRVVFKHLLEHQPEGLIIVMGDHQPPLVAPENARFDVPIHLISKDPALLEQALELGFKQRLRLYGRLPHVVRHEGLFSMLARTLHQCCTDRSQPAPQLMPFGASIPGEIEEPGAPVK